MGTNAQRAEAMNDIWRTSFGDKVGRERAQADEEPTTRLAPKTGLQEKLAAGLWKSVEAPFTAEEIDAAFSHNNAKAPGSDGIKPAIWTAAVTSKGVGRAALAEVLRAYYNAVLQTDGAHPWTLTTITPIPKRPEEPMTATNARPIAKQDGIAKAMAGMMSRRIGREAFKHDLYHAGQGAFVIGGNVLARINVMLDVMEDSYEHGKRMNACMLDLSAAYNSIEWNVLRAAQVRLGVPEQATHYLTELQKRQRIQTTLADGTDSTAFEPTKGIGQGCPASPGECNKVIDVLLERLERARERLGYQMGRQGQDGKVVAEQFADDSVVYARSEQALSSVVAEFQDEIENNLRMTINPRKSSTLTSGPALIRVHDGEDPIAQAGQGGKTFKYLGLHVQNMGHAPDGERRQTEAQLWAPTEARLTSTMGLMMHRATRNNMPARVFKYYLETIVRPVLEWTGRHMPTRQRTYDKIDMVFARAAERVLNITHTRASPTAAATLLKIDLIPSDWLRIAHGWESYRSMIGSPQSRMTAASRCGWTGTRSRPHQRASRRTLTRSNSNEPRLSEPNRRKSGWAELAKANVRVAQRCHLQNEVSEELEERSRWRNTAAENMVLAGGDIGATRAAELAGAYQDVQTETKVYTDGSVSNCRAVGVAVMLLPLKNKPETLTKLLKMVNNNDGPARKQRMIKFLHEECAVAAVRTTPEAASVMATELMGHLLALRMVAADEDVAIFTDSQSGMEAAQAWEDEDKRPKSRSSMQRKDGWALRMAIVRAKQKRTGKTTMHHIKAHPDKVKTEAELGNALADLAAQVAGTPVWWEETGRRDTKWPERSVVAQPELLQELEDAALVWTEPGRENWWEQNGANPDTAQRGETFLLHKDGRTVLSTELKSKRRQEWEQADSRQRYRTAGDVDAIWRRHERAEDDPAGTDKAERRFGMLALSNKVKIPLPYGYVSERCSFHEWLAGKRADARSSFGRVKEDEAKFGCQLCGMHHKYCNVWHIVMECRATAQAMEATTAEMEEEIAGHLRRRVPQAPAWTRARWTIGPLLTPRSASRDTHPERKGQRTIAAVWNVDVEAACLGVLPVTEMAKEFADEWNAPREGTTKEMTELVLDLAEAMSRRTWKLWKEWRRQHKDRHWEPDHPQARFFSSRG